MKCNQRGRMEIIERPVTVRGNIHRVPCDRVEAEIARNGFAIERKTASGQSAGAKRHDVHPGASFEEAFAVAGKHLEIREDVMRPENGLSAPRMGVAGDDSVRVTPCDRDERREKSIE